MLRGPHLIKYQNRYFEHFRVLKHPCLAWMLSPPSPLPSIPSPTPHLRHGTPGMLSTYQNIWKCKFCDLYIYDEIVDKMVLNRHRTDCSEWRSTRPPSTRRAPVTWSSSRRRRREGHNVNQYSPSLYQWMCDVDKWFFCLCSTSQYCGPCVAGQRKCNMTEVV